MHPNSSVLLRFSLLRIQRALSPDLPVGDEWVTGWHQMQSLSSCREHLWEEALSSLFPFWLQVLGQEGLSLWVILPYQQPWSQLVAPPGPATDASCSILVHSHALLRQLSPGLTWCVNPLQLPAAGHLQAMQKQEKKTERERERRNFYTQLHYFLKKSFQTHHKFIKLEESIILLLCRPILTNMGISSRMHPQGLLAPWALPLCLDFR